MKPRLLEDGDHLAGLEDWQWLLATSRVDFQGTREPAGRHVPRYQVEPLVVEENCRGREDVGEGSGAGPGAAGPTTDTLP